MNVNMQTASAKNRVSNVIPNAHIAPYMSRKVKLIYVWDNNVWTQSSNKRKAYWIISRLNRLIQSIEMHMFFYLLSDWAYFLFKCSFPTVHFDDSHWTDDLWHDLHTFIGHLQNSCSRIFHATLLRRKIQQSLLTEDKQTNDQRMLVWSKVVEYILLQ